VIEFVSGLIVGGYLIAGLFFLRFHRQTRDRLFLAFAVAFWLLAAQRAAVTFMAHHAEAPLWLYVLRLLAFVLIAAAIVDKNRSSGA
jgi:hypothetical protein